MDHLSLSLSLSLHQSCVPVDLMPGANDPANYQLPQQPLHLCMFPRARATGRLSSLTNPYHTVIGGTVYVGIL